jgi:hypothetical protein
MEYAWGDEKCIKDLVGNHEGKRPFGRSGRKCKYITLDLTEMGLEGVDWVHLAQTTVQCGLL